MKCSVCGLSGVRLWRNAHVFADSVELFCVACALDREYSRENLPEVFPMPRGLAAHLDSGSLGYLVAARPTEDGSFWGHASGDEASVAAWVALPFARAVLRDEALEGRLPVRNPA